MTQEESLAIVRRAFAHVDVVKITVAYDEDCGEMKAIVYVPEEQYGDAIGDEGEIARNAAIESGMSIEVEYAENLPNS